MASRREEKHVCTGRNPREDPNNISCQSREDNQAPPNQVCSDFNTHDFLAVNGQMRISGDYFLQSSLKKQKWNKKYQ